MGSGRDAVKGGLRTGPATDREVARPRGRTMRARDLLLDGVTLVTAICALIVTIHVVRVRPRASSVAPAPSPRELPSATWKPLLQSGHRIGPMTAKLSVVEFGDFQCPICGAFEHVLDSMRMRYPRDFAVVFHQFPLSYHPLAYPLAKASECAARQGRFTAFHDSIYAEQSLLGVVPVEAFGGRAGVPDTAAFDRCLLHPGEVPAIEADVAYGKRIGVPGTPAIIVDGVMHMGDLTLGDLEHILQRDERATGGR